MNEPMIALVTGGARGIGHEVTRRLGAAGCVVLAAVRDPERAAQPLRELAADADVRPLRLDVTDPRSIESAARAVEKEHGRLDILVNNAGVALEHGRDPFSVDLDTVRRTYETNVFGPIALIQAFLPVLRKAAAARIVNVSSAIGSLTEWSDPQSPIALNAPVSIGYNSSKTALNAVTVAYAKALRDTGIRVNAADPGYVATELNGYTGHRSVAEGAEIIVALALADDRHSGRFVADFGAVAW